MILSLTTADNFNINYQDRLGRTILMELFSLNLFTLTNVQVTKLYTYKVLPPETFTRCYRWVPTFLVHPQQCFIMMTKDIEHDCPEAIQTCFSRKCQIY